MATPKGSYPPPRPYLENLDGDDLLNRLVAGAADGDGEADHYCRQNVYDGYIKALQDDLWSLGLRADHRWGVYDATTVECVARFQRAARRPERGGASEPVEVTFSGEVSGDCDFATRREIAVWKARGWYVPAEQLLELAAKSVFSYTSMQETGRELDSKMLYERNAAGESIPVYHPDAFEFVEEHPRLGMRVGWLGFDQRSGWLGRFLAKVYAVDPDLFADLPDHVEIFNAARRSSESARMSARLGPPDRWKNFLQQPGVEKVQLYFAWDAILRPLYEAAARNRIRTIRGLAFLCDVAYKLDVDTSIFIADACDYRDVRRSAADHLQPAMLSLAHLLTAGRPDLHLRFRRILQAEDLDDEIEYFWDLQVRLIEKFPAPPDTL